MKVNITHSKDNFLFTIQQDGLPLFQVCEGYMVLLVDAFADLTTVDPQSSLFETFRVTVEGDSVILKHSLRGAETRLLSLSNSSATKWAEGVMSVFGPVITSYSK